MVRKVQRIQQAEEVLLPWFRSQRSQHPLPRACLTAWITRWSTLHSTRPSKPKRPGVGE
jgi:hypothetical protein